MDVELASVVAFCAFVAGLLIGALRKRDAVGERGRQILPARTRIAAQDIEIKRLEGELYEAKAEAAFLRGTSLPPGVA